MDKKHTFSIWYFLATCLLVWFLSSALFGPMFARKTDDVPYSTFLMDLDEGKINNVNVTEDKIIYTLKAAAEKEKDVPMRIAVRIADPGIVNRLAEANVTFEGTLKTNSFFSIVLSILLPFLPLLIIWYFIYKRMQGSAGNIMSFGQNKSQALEGELPDVKFADVGGLGEAEIELREIIDFIKNPARFNEIGAKLPKGVLLVGPPGTGKTLLAKATAGEAGVPFFSMSGSSFVEMFVGVGAARVRDLFEQAKKKAPCIIFIDEVDAIGQSRATAGMMQNSERENTLNQLLTEMDGFKANNGVVLMAATNRPETLDEALVRPGRFDRQIQVVLPDEKGRLDILTIHTKSIRLDNDVDLEAIAKITSGFSGADLANIANEASLIAVRYNKKTAGMNEFDRAIERVMAGLQRKVPLSPPVRRRVAYHEMGHALVAYYTPGADPVHKVSIIPTSKGALGYTMQLPEEDQYLMTESELKAKLGVMLGGRAAELLVFKEATTGASNDLERATEVARRMVTEYGMSSRLGPIRFANSTGMYLQTGSSSRQDLSSETTREIDEEISALLKGAQDHALTLLKNHEHILHETAKVLQDEEVITGVRIGEIAGKE